MKTTINYRIACANQYWVKSKDVSKTVDIDFWIDYYSSFYFNENREIEKKAYEILNNDNAIWEHIYWINYICREDCKSLVYYVQTRGKNKWNIKTNKTLKTDNAKTVVWQKRIEKFLIKNPWEYKIINWACFYFF